MYIERTAAKRPDYLDFNYRESIERMGAHKEKRGVGNVVPNRYLCCIQFGCQFVVMLPY